MGGMGLIFTPVLVRRPLGPPGADPEFSERGVRKFKERGLECSPRSYRGLYC